LRGFRGIVARRIRVRRVARAAARRAAHASRRSSPALQNALDPPLRASFREVRTDIQGNGAIVPPFLIPLESKGHGQEEGKEEGHQEGDEEGSSQEVVPFFDFCL